MKVYYGKAVYNQKEIKAVTNVLKKKPLTLIDGPEVKELEGRKWIKVEGEAVHLTDPYSYKPYIFLDDE